MKRAIAALLLTAAVATPALAGGFRQGGAITPSPAFAYDKTTSGKSYLAPTSQMTSLNGVYADATMRARRQAEPRVHS